MTPTGPRLDRDVLARLGQDVYARIVRPQLRPEDHGKYVVVDVESGAFEVDAFAHAAIARLRARIPDVQAWMERAGFPTTNKL
jgi:hypothetical protein